MYYALNVIHYLNGEGYDAKSLYSDIEETFEAVRTKPSNGMIQRLYNSFNEYHIQRRSEIYTFANILMQQGYPEEYQQLLQYYYLPFRTSRDPLADKMIYENMFKLKNLTLKKVIMDNLYMSVYATHPLFIERFEKFIEEEQLDFDTFKDGSKLGRANPIPMPQEILSTFVSYNEAGLPKPIEVVNNYGELSFYDYLTSTLQPTDQIFWVSRDLGSGFGYDIAIYSTTNNSLRMYKVKTTEFIGNFERIVLSESEKRMSNKVQNSPNEEYHIARLCVREPYQMVDICDRDLTAKDLYNPQKERVLINNNTDLRLI